MKTIGKHELSVLYEEFYCYWLIDKFQKDSKKSRHEISLEIHYYDERHFSISINFLFDEGPSVH